MIQTTKLTVIAEAMVSLWTPKAGYFGRVNVKPGIPCSIPDPAEKPNPSRA
jgi:hypothetical protein